MSFRGGAEVEQVEQNGPEKQALLHCSTTPPPKGGGGGGGACGAGWPAVARGGAERTEGRMTETCITEGIWRAAMDDGHDLATAQGRAALDRRLRSELAEIEDASLRAHAAEILRQKWAKAFPDDHGDSLDGILRRLRRIEDALGFGRDDRPVAAIMERG